MASRKRKHVPSTSKQLGTSQRHDTYNDLQHAEPSGVNPALIIQAHEVDLLHGLQAKLAAQSLEVGCHKTSRSGEEDMERKIGGGLIKWGGNMTRKNIISLFDDDDDKNGRDDANDGRDVWVDRYDARLLLETLPLPSLAPSDPVPESPTGWSDLPSDDEDTFFLTPDEADEYHRAKRRRMIDRNRTERLKAMREEEGTRDTQDIWGGSDEEPDDTQKALMRRTATHVLSSLNSAQLEMRILANHGADKRFAFLKGRWAQSWKSIKETAKMEIEKARMPQNAPIGLGGLEGYGDSDEDKTEEAKVEPSENRTHKSSEAKVTEGAIKEARRARAKEWAQNRRALKADQS